MIIRTFAAGCLLALLVAEGVNAAETSGRAVHAKEMKPGPIAEEGFVPIGGIDQWVTIKGYDRSHPAVLFVHGGPGNPLSPFADAVYGSWKKEFILAQWDQRGAGKTYGRNTPAGDEALTMERMTADGIQVAEHVARRLEKNKVILMGDSWGAALAAHMAKSRPDLFHALVLTSPLLGGRQDLQASHARLKELARQEEDEKTLAALDAIGAPPWKNPRHFSVLRRAVRAYELKRAWPAPPSWWEPAPGYDTLQARTDYTKGEDYSFLQFVGPKGDGMLWKLNLPASGLKLKLPVYFIQGEEDLLTMPAVTKRYFDKIVAPVKEYVLVPRTGHDTNPPIINAQHRILAETIRPSVK
ncbi:MAG: alpha/beta hydrolase family protein [Paucimonas sp.]|jgi:pimeloyl-ACP methyl ester carboxylesterase|nr:alpha/beta hydrolase family protein [Paucimonas sp.]